MELVVVSLVSTCSSRECSSHASIGRDLILPVLLQVSIRKLALSLHRRSARTPSHKGYHESSSSRVVPQSQRLHWYCSTSISRYVARRLCTRVMYLLIYTCTYVGTRMCAYIPDCYMRKFPVRVPKSVVKATLQLTGVTSSRITMFCWKNN